MNSATFLHDTQRIVTGNGFKKVIPGIGINSLTEADGDRLDNGSTPPYAVLETNGLGVAVASSNTFIGEFNILVPQDYDESRDYLRIRLLAGSAGDTDTPRIDAAIYSKRGGVALGDDLDPTISAVVNTNTAIADWVEIVVDGESLAGGDVLHVELLTGGTRGTSDALHIYELEVVYNSCLVYFDGDNR